MGIINTFFKNISDLKDKIQFNLIATGNRLDLKENCILWLYDKKYLMPNDKFLFDNDISNFIWKTYRNNISPIIYNSKVFTSDAGWGCMIRAGQMILARGIYRLLCKADYPDYHYNTLLLFLDNEIKFKKIRETSFSVSIIILTRVIVTT
jgi:hypothetical protein